MKRYSVSHETTYKYGLPVEFGMHTARLSPVSGPRQKLIDHQIDVIPQPTWTVAFTDHFGNGMQHIAIETAHQLLSVTQRSIIEIATPEWSEVPPGPPWETVRDAMIADAFSVYPEAAEFIYPSPLVVFDPAATEFARRAFAAGVPIAQAALNLACMFKAEFAYAPGATTIATSVPEIMTGRQGVCQDFAHAMIAGLRSLRIPARYVSGYLKTYAPPGLETASEPLVGADATHAWVSVWCGPDLGWLEFDPTNALAVTDEHISVAYGRDFSDVTPLRGVIVGGGDHTPGVAVTVELLANETGGETPPQ